MVINRVELVEYGAAYAISTPQPSVPNTHFEVSDKSSVNLAQEFFPPIELLVRRCIGSLEHFKDLMLINTDINKRLSAAPGIFNA